ncbi:hypothetical protein [Azospirillum sp. TSO22-1]|uniref:hypothetical protein n=1 Tax=Azospirillum sp. TSO22-1 TaxID=716789 RepID=UPI000D618884|nr:hypothetical protein [Azospirillum sp. TSO22-1]PWC35111.1 hypothetical protein TSO221_30485 [Azospirillum sp. TSO22-1]
MFEWFWDAVTKVQHTPVEHKEAVMLPPERVLEDPFPNLVDGQKFKSGGCYFGVRLAGMHVLDARRFGTTLSPLFVSLAEFKQRGQTRSVPFSVGPHEFMDSLRSVVAAKDGDPPSGWIERRNVPVVPPTPVGVDNLSLFVGLYSVPGSDVVRKLLNVVGDLSKTVGAVMPAAAVMNPALDIARTVYAGFGSLVGLDSVQALVQAQDGRALPGTGSGYLVVVNGPPGVVEKEKMVVRGGKLCRDKKMVTDLDYCLVAIERYATVLEEETHIAPDLFQAEWAEVLEALATGTPGAPKEPMRKLMAVVRGTPALIDADRVAAMAAYLQRYTAEVSLAEQLQDIVKGGGGGPVADIVGALTAARAQQTVRLAADKISTVADLVDAAQRAPRDRQVESPAWLAKRIRKDLLDVGEGADAALADALLHAV